MDATKPHQEAPTMTLEQTLKLIRDEVIEAVTEAGDQGAPSWMLYEVLMGYGASFGTYQGLMAHLVTAGKLRRDGDLYFVA
jgi:hypothetical protein